MNVKIIKKVIEVEAMVESESTEGAFYIVSNDYNEWGCTCPHHQQRAVECKHIKAVKREVDLNG